MTPTQVLKSREVPAASVMILPVSTQVTEKIKNVCTLPMATTAIPMRQSARSGEPSSHWRRLISRRSKSVSAML